jgi:hypothetical protein
MDAFIVSAYVKNSLKHKKNRKNLEHAAFIINPSTSNNTFTTKTSYRSDDSLNDYSISDNSIRDNSVRDYSVRDNSLTDNSYEEDNIKFATNTDNSDNSEKIFANTDNSRNITVNNIKVNNIKNKESRMLKEQEEYEEDDEYEEEYNNNKANKISSITFLLMLIINSYAAYLSWECNSRKDYPLVLKVVFSFFAFIFGSLYLLYYILFRFDECNRF